MKMYVVIEGGAESLNLEFEQFFIAFWCIDVHWGCAPLQSECRKKPNESQHMVSVDVADEDGVKLVEIQMQASDGSLCTFTTIYHKEFASHFYYL
jgi:hypothetical protein